ncbi:hypothetical protein [Streptomyces sp. V3I7]|uniref:hypothetical protein n=1 Tax=Streptomyces sp. V3I7 TaxID=3042278 RepID=UPI00277EDD23|nr:hypothetical protein [Streptomyces sp. V3I7]MDQ0993208.1 putative membrane protein YdbT with pleckstrin-like domain [Streptomyces sp. V3I7]
MGTKTADVTETGIESKDAEATSTEKETTQAQRDETVAETTPAEAGTDEATRAEDVADTDEAPEEAAVPTGVGQGAGAVVSAGLGLVSLTGGWIGTVAAARQNLIGQLKTASTANVAAQVKAVYGDAWHATALWAGVFALAALVTGVVVLVRPAFGAPGRPQAPWIKSVAWAGVSLGVIGLLLAALKYSDVLLGLPIPS